MTVTKTVIADDTEEINVGDDEYDIGETPVEEETDVGDEPVDDEPEIGPANQEKTEKGKENKKAVNGQKDQSNSTFSTFGWIIVLCATAFIAITLVLILRKRRCSNKNGGAK